MNKMLLINILAIFLVVLLANLAHAQEFEEVSVRVSNSGDIAQANKSTLSANHLARPIVKRTQVNLFEEGKESAQSPQAQTPVSLSRDKTAAHMSQEKQVLHNATSVSRTTLDAKNKSAVASQRERTAQSTNKQRRLAALRQANKQIAFKTEQLAHRYTILAKRMLEHLHSEKREANMEQYQQAERAISQALTKLIAQKEVLHSLSQAFISQETNNTQTTQQFVVRLRTEGKLFKQEVAALRHSLSQALALVLTQDKQVDSADATSKLNKL